MNKGSTAPSCSPTRTVSLHCDDRQREHYRRQSLRNRTAHGRRTRGSDARYVPPGHLFYMVGTTLFAVRFNVDSMRITGDAVPVVEDVMRVLGPNTNIPGGNHGVAEDGTLACLRATAGATAQRTLAWIDRQGRETAVDAPLRAYSYAR